MVVLLTVPRTRTLSPFVTWPMRSASSSSTVTFCPVEVVTVNLAWPIPLTVPDAPPAAGPERAFEPLAGAFDPAPAARWALAVGTAAPPVDVARSTDIPVTPHARTAAAIQPAAFFDRCRRRRGEVGGGAAAGESTGIGGCSYEGSV